MSKYYLVLSTIDDLSEAKEIARKLIEDQLVACVNVIPDIASIYRWEGKIEESEEVLILIKTVKYRLDELISKVKDLHSYDVPEIIAISIEEGSMNYLKWLSKNVK